MRPLLSLLLTALCACRGASTSTAPPQDASLDTASLDRGRAVAIPEPIPPGVVIAAWYSGGALSTDVARIEVFSDGSVERRIAPCARCPAGDAGAGCTRVGGAWGGAQDACTSSLHLDQNAMAELLDAFRRNRFVDLSDDYPFRPMEDPSDNGVVTLLFVEGGRGKVVRHYLGRKGVPPELVDIEMRIRDL